MILLTKNSLTKGRRVPLESMSLNLKERDSTASLVPADTTGISVGGWMLDDTKPGANIVWRVKSIKTAYATDTATVELEHAIMILRDNVLFGEVTPATITGKESSTTCTAKQAVNYILGKQKDWILGSFDYSSVSMPYKFEGDTLWDALQTVSETLEDCWWSYDMTVYPFKLNIKKQATEATCELRQGRNLATVTKTIDTSGMYTRFYPIGKDDLHIKEDYVEKNVKTYGVISKIETDTSKETTDELKKWANRRLAKHAEPRVSITAEGAELADATGESLDRLTLGRICRIPLAEFDTTIEERIVELRYPDKVREPERVTVTLANNQEDVATIIAQSIKEGASPSGKAARSGARSSKEDHAWFEDTSDHVAMCAIGIIGTDAKGNPNWVRLSRLEVNENGIFGEVQSVQNDVVIASTRIDQNENAITLEAERRVAEDKSLAGRIQVEADKVGMVVEVKDGKKVIKAGEIAVAINNAGETVANINADKIVLDGKTKINDVLGVQNNSLTIKGNAYLASGTFYPANVSLASGGKLSFITKTAPLTYADIKAADIDTMIIKAEVDENTGNLKMWKRGQNVATDDPIINFNKAATPVITWDSSQSVGRIKAVAGGTAYYNIAPRFYQYPGDQSHPNGQYVIELSHVEGQTTQSLSKSSKEFHLGLNSSRTQVQIQDTNDSKISSTPTFTIPLTDDSIYSNGIYEAPAGYVGYNNFEVSVNTVLSWESSQQSVRALTGGNLIKRYSVNCGFLNTSDGYVIQCYHTGDQGNIEWLSQTSTTYKLARSGTTVQMQRSNGTQLANTPTYTIPLSTKTIDSNGTYTPGSGEGVGFSSVTVAVPAGPDPSYTTEYNSSGTFSSGTQPGTALAGWNPIYVSDSVPNSTPNTYRYIKFKVDGKQRSFYFA